MFAETYGLVRSRIAREGTPERPQVSEHVLQCIWYDKLFPDADLRTDEGMPIRIVSPGRWNRSEGPDFKGAEVAFNGVARTGDIEIHLAHAGWKQHGHDIDGRYDNVILHVVFDTVSPKEAPHTSQGRRVPALLLGNYIDLDLMAGDDEQANIYPQDLPAAQGQCAAFVAEFGPDRIGALLDLAGDWRLIAKARALRERADRVGMEQAVYEALLGACGFSKYKHHFRLLAQQLPYARARQLAQQDPLILETAFLQLGGLLPDALPEGTSAMPHFARLRALHRDNLPGLKRLPLVWSRAGVRPVNYPERRLAGAAMLVARTAREGLLESIEQIWKQDIPERERRLAFDAMSPAPMGFWANRCSWTGKKLAAPVALLGPARVLSVIGNVFVTTGLALARQTHNRSFEERVSRLFQMLPKESDNRILKDMTPRLFGACPPPKLTFRRQQGLLQVFQDWCAPNPGCTKCSVTSLLGTVEQARK